MEILTRSDAKRLGLKHYFTGSPCPLGHVVKRYVSTAACSLCAKIATLKWDKENNDKKRLKDQRWRDNHRDEMRQRDRERYAANPEKYIASVKEWRMRHPDFWRRRDRAKHLAIQARYDQNHRDVRRAKDRERYAADPSHRREYAKEYAKKYPQKILAVQAARRNGRLC